MVRPGVLNWLGDMELTILGAVVNVLGKGEGGALRGWCVSRGAAGGELGGQAWPT